jgi:hypothetical protein
LYKGPAGEKGELFLKQKQTMRSFVYLTMGLAMLFYALPNLPTVTFSIAGVFTASWLCFALLIVGANLYYLIGADKEQQKRHRQQAWVMQTMQPVRPWGTAPVKSGSHRQAKRRMMH